jgi:lambda family phage portal protein
MLDGVSKLLGRFLKRSNDGAAGGRRWRGFIEQPSALLSIHADRAVILRRARALYANTAIGRSAVDGWVSALVGSGIKVQSSIADPTLRGRISAGFERWTDDADADDVTDFYGLQVLVATLLVRDGEAFVLMVPMTDGRLQLKVLDADQVDSSYTRESVAQNGNVIVQGVEIDARGRTVAYHVRKQNPGLPIVTGIETVRVPAEQMLHIFRRDTAGQLRGMSWLAPCLLKIRDYDDATDAQIMRQKVGALLAGVIVNPEGTGSPFEGESSGNGVLDGGLEPGTLKVLSNPGQDVRFTTPPAIGADAIDFLKLELREIASALGLPASVLTGDLTEANFSSMRVGLIEFRRRAETLQHSVISFQLLRPVFRRWLALEIMAGRLQIPGFLRDPDSFMAMKAIPPHNAWLDPLKDVKAEREAIAGGLISRRESVASRGYDIEQVDQEIADDNERAKRLGLVFDAPPPDRTIEVAAT